MGSYGFCMVLFGSFGVEFFRGRSVCHWVWLGKIVVPGFDEATSISKVWCVHPRHPNTLSGSGMNEASKEFSEACLAFRGFKLTPTNTRYDWGILEVYSLYVWVKPF